MEVSEIRQFRKSLRKFERLDKLLNDRCCQDITVAQCHVLLEIEGKENVTTVQLVKELKLDKSTLSRTVDELVQKGLVERLPHPSDRRFTPLQLTESGIQKSVELHRENDGYYTRIFQRIPKEKQKEILDGFQILVDAVNDYYEDDDRNDFSC
ncbi:MarR family winged helix-turn-helix transcriptional regulator [Acidobacteriota bacterium]